jgi:hypothetical protein
MGFIVKNEPKPRKNGWCCEGRFKASCKCNTQTPIHCPQANRQYNKMGGRESFFSSVADGVMAILAAAMVECHFC